MKIEIPEQLLKYAHRHNQDVEGGPIRFSAPDKVKRPVTSKKPILTKQQAIAERLN